MKESPYKDLTHTYTHAHTEGPYKDLTVFIDPIDGTREFSTGKGTQCSICIGFASSDGLPVAG